MKRLSMIVAAAVLLSSQALAAPGIKIGKYEPCQPHEFMNNLFAMGGMKLRSQKPHEDGVVTLYTSERRSHWAIFLIPDENQEYMCLLSEGKGKLPEPQKS